jgi:presenilin-like A22 family membrane protease
MLYVKMLISFMKFMIVILYLNRSKIFKMFAL